MHQQQEEFCKHITTEFTWQLANQLSPTCYSALFEWFITNSSAENPNVSWYSIRRPCSERRSEESGARRKCSIHKENCCSKSDKDQIPQSKNSVNHAV